MCYYLTVRDDDIFIYVPLSNCILMCTLLDDGQCERDLPVKTRYGVSSADAAALQRRLLRGGATKGRNEKILYNLAI